MSKKVKIALVALAAIAAAVYLFLAFANPQWHWKLYAHQASGTENGLLEPGAGYTGEWNNWDETGRVVSRYAYKNGRRDGPYTTYDKDGNILSEGQYANGQLEGVQKINQGGGAHTEVTFVNGKRHGVERSWYPNGRIAVEAPWVDGVQEGAVTFYYENGAVQAAIPYYAGKIEGVQKTFFETGAVQGEETYRNNLKNGRSVFFTPEGAREMALNYRDDKMDGIQTWYHPNGEKAKEIILNHGIPHGHWREWDGKGELLMDEEYDMGELKKKETDTEDDAEATKKEEPERIASGDQ